jgi:IS1 family transposase
VSRDADRQSHYRLPSRERQAEMNQLPFEKEVQIANALIEGVSVRATARLLNVEHKTVLRVLQRIGTRCSEFLDKTIRGVRSKRVQVDEIWTYVFKKEARITSNDPAERGDQYVFIALDADSKLAISHTIGKRNAITAYYLMQDLKSRLANRVQLTTDGFRPYLMATEDNFGADIDYAMLVKVYGKGTHDKEAPEWYKPPQVLAAIPTRITGNPEWAHISTSYIERQNLTLRMQARRFTRLTNAFSKKLTNLCAQVALHFAHYNFVRIHQTLRCTPAMAAGLTNHVWELSELLI